MFALLTKASVWTVTTTSRLSACSEAVTGMFAFEFTTSRRGALNSKDSVRCSVLAEHPANKSAPTNNVPAALDRK
ncbi:hypothetical protein CH293_19455 [Rhodococcus sp. 14-2470-1b]|nr:hypothetical protein CH293_19455 [Rhodococcus sp. 14-2470-1b]